MWRTIRGRGRDRPLLTRLRVIEVEGKVHRTGSQVPTGARRRVWFVAFAVAVLAGCGPDAGTGAVEERMPPWPPGINAGSSGATVVVTDTDGHELLLDLTVGGPLSVERAQWMVRDVTCPDNEQVGAAYIPVGMALYVRSKKPTDASLALRPGPVDQPAGSGLPVIVGVPGKPYRCTHDDILASWRSLEGPTPTLLSAWVLVPGAVDPSGAIDLSRTQAIVLHPALGIGASADHTSPPDNAATVSALAGCPPQVICVPIGPALT